MADKRISQLNSHTSPSGSDLLVIVNNNETKKITYANLTAGITGSSTDISALNQFTQSFNSFSSSVHTEILAGTNEQDLSNLVTNVTLGVLSGSVDGRLDRLEANTGSYLTNLNGAVSSSSQLTSSYDNRYVLSGSITQTTWDNISGKPAGLVSQSTDIADFVFTTDTITNSDITLHATDGDIVLNADGNVYKGSASAGNQLLTTGYFGTIIGDESRINTGTGHSITDNLDNIINSIPSVTSLNNATSSYETKGSGILSGSVSYTSLTNIPSGIVSQSVSLSSLNTFTSSYFTDSASIDSRVLTEKGRIDAILSASTANSDTFAEIVTLINSVDTTNDNAFASYYTSSNARISSLENATSSYETKGRGIVSGSSQLTSSLDLRYALSASYLTSLNGAFSSSIQTLGGSGVYSSSAQLPNGLISGSSQLTASYDIRYATSASYLTSLNGAISSSSQLTASYDTRYTLSGSVQPLPSGVISGSSQLTASYDTRYALSGSSANINTGSFATTGSNTFIGTETISGSLLLSGSFSYNGTPLQNGFAFAQPTLTRILDNVSYTGSSAWVTSYNGNGGAIIVTANVSGYRTTGGLGTAQLLRDGVAVASQTFYFNLANYHTPLPSIVYVRNSETGSHTYSIYFSNILADTNDYATINVLEYGNSAMFPTTIISGSTQLTSSFDTRYEGVGRGIISGSTQLTSSFETKGSGIYSSSAQLPSGLISGSSQLPSGLVSGSSQLTSSYDTRYTLSGSISAVPAGTISGSSQLTASFDTRYLNTDGDNVISGSSQLTASYDARYALSSSVSSISSSFNSRFNGLVTTGSNTFSGSQIFSGSMTVTSGQVIASTITNNSSSLYLTSGSNLYVQNNGIVEITGSIVLNGTTYTSLTGSGAIPAGTISGSSQLTSSFDTRYAPSASYLTSLNGALSSSTQITNGSGIVSGSSQLTASYDTRYILSGSINSVPAGTISGSSQLTSSLDLRYETKGSGIVSGSSQLTASYDSRYLTIGGDNVISGSSQLTSSFETVGRGIISSSAQLPSGLISGSSQLPNGIVSGSSQLTSSYDTRYTLSGSISAVPAGTISGSSQLTASFDTRYAPSASYLTSLNGAISSSTQITNGSGIISGSSQLTASYDTRYALSGSGGSGTIPAGTVSGSSQLTSSYDGRYTLTSSFNSFTASAQAVTTGSNSFNGTQTITGSLIITTGSFFASQLIANTASLYLTSGSNLYVQNNGLVEITGSIIATSITGSIAATNGVISGSSQLTASYDTRYTLSGSISSVPAGTVSGSSQLTSSLDLRYEGVGRGIVSGSTQLTSSFARLNATNNFTGAQYIGGDVVLSNAGTLFTHTIEENTNDPFGTYGLGLYYVARTGGHTFSGSVTFDNGITGSIRATNGVISGSSQLTSSYDARYEGVGRSIVSGSSQLTSSFDGRYLQTGSFNSYTSSINSFTSSQQTLNGTYATTGSNTFRGTETISGSLLVSGSTILTGSLSIQSGSITMPNRPAFRVIGTTGDRTAPLTLSGSLVSVEYNEGNYFSTTNGKFTAPTAGLYHVYYNGRVGSVNAMQQVIVYKNTSIVQLMWESSTNTGAAHFGVSGIVKLAVNDTLEAKVAVGTIQFDANDSWGVAYIG